MKNYSLQNMSKIIYRKHRLEKGVLICVILSNFNILLITTYKTHVATF